MYRSECTKTRHFKWKIHFMFLRRGHSFLPKPLPWWERVPPLHTPPYQAFWVHPAFSRIPVRFTPLDIATGDEGIQQAFVCYCTAEMTHWGRLLYGNGILFSRVLWSWPPAMSSDAGSAGCFATHRDTDTLGPEADNMEVSNGHHSLDSEKLCSLCWSPGRRHFEIMCPVKGKRLW